MSKRAEQFARKLYTPWSEDGMSRKDNTDVIEACIKGYEQAEKDAIERVIDWVRKNAYIYTDTQNDEEGNLMTVFFEKAFIDDLKNAIEEEL